MDNLVDIFDIPEFMQFNTRPKVLAFLDARHTIDVMQEYMQSTSD